MIGLNCAITAITTTLLLVLIDSTATPLTRVIERAFLSLPPSLLAFSYYLKARFTCTGIECL